MEPEDPGRIPVGPIVHCFYFFFSEIMLNYFIQVIWNCINGNKNHSLAFYIESLVVGFNLALLKDN